MSNRVLSGGRAEFFLNGYSMGFATGVDINENIRQEPVNVLNNLRPVEFAVTGYSVSFTVNEYRLPNSDLVDAGLWPQMGRTAEEMKRNFLNFEPMTADLYDTFTSTMVGKLFGVVPQTRRITFTQQGLVMTNATFLALGFADEGSPSV